MNSYVTGKTIRDMREKKKLTQKQLADMISVSDRAVSKWETQKGLPDITLLEPLAGALGVTVAALLSGECIENKNQSANMIRSHFYICPVCGNVIHAMGDGSFFLLRNQSASGAGGRTGSGTQDQYRNDG